jgi:hypothetical protein
MELLRTSLLLDNRLTGENRDNHFLRHLRDRPAHPTVLENAAPKEEEGGPTHTHPHNMHTQLTSPATGRADSPIHALRLHDRLLSNAHGPNHHNRQER